MRDFEPEWMNPAAIAHRQVPRWLFAGIEMLVKPVTGWAIDARFAPVDVDYSIFMPVGVRVHAPLFVPQQNITDRLRADDDRARTMIVRLVIFAHRPLAEMTDQSVARHLELRQTQTGAFDFETFEHRRFDIGNKISLPDIDHAAHVALFTDFEIIVFAVVAIFKTVWTIENKILVSINIEGERRVSHGEKTHRFARAVEQAMRGIERRRKQAPLVPFEHFLVAVIVPKFRRALAVQNT